MRVKPDKKYCPNPHMCNNMTLYEMAYSMSESEPQDPQEAMPYLVTWLLKDFFDNYKFNDESFPDEYAYNIAYFLVYNFINRESNSRMPEVFRTRLLNEIVNMNLNHDFYELINDLKEATTQLSRTIQTDDDNKHNATNLQTNNLTEQRAATDLTMGTDTTTYNTRESTDVDGITSSNSQTVTDSDTSISNTETLNTKDRTTNNLTDTMTHNTTDAASGSSRNVDTDYPQSTVNTTVVGSWDYASGASDVTSSSTTTHTGTDTDVKTGTSDLDRTGTISNSGSNSVDDTTSSEVETTVDNSAVTQKTGTEALNRNNTETINSNVTNTGTVTVSNMSSDNRDISTEETWSAISGFEMNAAQIEIYAKHDNFYKELMRRFEKCFISIYVDDDRLGWLDPSINLLSQWNPL